MREFRVGQQLLQVRNGPFRSNDTELPAEKAFAVVCGCRPKRLEKLLFDRFAQLGIGRQVEHDLFDLGKRPGVLARLEGRRGLQGFIEPLERIALDCQSATCQPQCRGKQHDSQ